MADVTTLLASAIQKSNEVIDLVKGKFSEWDNRVNHKITWADGEVKKEIHNLESWKENIRKEYPVINLFKNPSLETDKNGIKNLVVGYNSHCSVEFSVEDDTGSGWWRRGGKRLKVKVSADGSDGSGCCGSWYASLLATGVATSIPTNVSNPVPITYMFEYKVISKTDKAFMKIGWETGATIDSSISEEWKIAYKVITNPAQRMYFASFYPGENNGQIEVLIRNILIAPGIVNKFSNYIIGG